MTDPDNDWHKGEKSALGLRLGCLITLIVIVLILLIVFYF